MTMNKLELNIKTNDLGTEQVPKSVITEDKKLLYDIESFIKKILTRKFPDSSVRQTVERFDNRFSFSCPYCGDSSKSSKLKRGNIFFKNQMYKCFNCFISKRLNKFIEEWKRFLDIDELDFDPADLENFIIYDTSFIKESSVSVLLDKQIIGKYRFEREFIRRRFKFCDITNTEGERYIKSRNIPFKKWEYFDFDPITKSVVIYNLDKEGFVLSFSKRSLNPNAYLKYKICDLFYIYKELNLDIEDEKEFDIVNKLFSYFNLFRISFNDTITVTEGQIDSLFYPNSFSLNSLAKDLPFDIDDCQFLLDFDKSGIKKSKELILKNKKVFLWKKFIKDNNLNITNIKKLDLNDLILHCRNNSINYSKLNIKKYFSNNKLDVLFL